MSGVEKSIQSWFPGKFANDADIMLAAKVYLDSESVSSRTLIERCDKSITISLQHLHRGNMGVNELEQPGLYRNIGIAYMQSKIERLNEDVKRLNEDNKRLNEDVKRWKQQMNQEKEKMKYLFNQVSDMMKQLRAENALVRAENAQLKIQVQDIPGMKVQLKGMDMKIDSMKSEYEIRSKVSHELYEDESVCRKKAEVARLTELLELRNA